MAYLKNARLFMPTAVVVLGLAGLVACDSSPRASDDNQILPARTGKALEAKPNSPIGDAPMPEGFVVIESRSRAHAAAGSRTIHHVYQGQSSRAEVVNFYRAVLSQYQWERKSESFTSSVINLAWTKGREILLVKVKTSGGVATIELDIHNANEATAVSPSH